jgi:hypothetical protein
MSGRSRPKYSGAVERGAGRLLWALAEPAKARPKKRPGEQGLLEPRRLRTRSSRGPPAKRLGAIYEEDSEDFSGGSRPGRNRRQARDSPRAAITARKADWIPEARTSKDTLAPFLANGRSVFRGMRDSGQREAGRSPPVANVFLCHALDLWADRQGKREARGEARQIRLADDFVARFQRKDDAGQASRRLDGKTGQIRARPRVLKRPGA